MDHRYPNVIPGKLTDADKTRIAELAARDFKPGRIAQILNRHPSTIYQWMTSHGLRSVTSTRPRPPKRKIFERNGVAVATFRPYEDMEISELRAKGWYYSTIAAHLTKKFGHPRVAQTIRSRWLTLMASARPNLKENVDHAHRTF